MKEENLNREADGERERERERVSDGRLRMCERRETLRTELLQH